MRTYVIRFNHPEKGSAFVEITAGTEMDAQCDFESKQPASEIISIHEKPRRFRLSSSPN